MSVARPHAAPQRLVRSSATRSFAALLLLASVACDADNEDDLGLSDGSFGRPIDYLRDGGMDAASPLLDAALPPGPTVRVRFMHGFANLGALTVCHDPDGSGPSPTVLLAESARPLRADWGSASETLTLPERRSGAFTLHREPMRVSADAGLPLDAGSSDGGIANPCDPATLELTIPLPIPDDWIAPFSARGVLANDDLPLLPVLADAPALTLLGAGLALSASGLDARAEQVRASWLLDHPNDFAGAEREAATERARLEATFGPRALIQTTPTHEGAQTFSLSVFHAIPNLTQSGAERDRDVAAVRLCITAGKRVLSVLPSPEAPGVPFRLRVPIGSAFEPRVDYEVAAYAERDFDAAKSGCTTALKPVAQASFKSDRFQAGRSYTLALVGIVSAPELCSASSKSFVRPGCPRPASELTPRIELLED